MLFIIDDTKFFIYPEYSVIQRSAMVHTCKWAIADVISGKNTFSTVDHSCNEL